MGFRGVIVVVLCVGEWVVWFVVVVVLLFVLFLFLFVVVVRVFCFMREKIHWEIVPKRTFSTISFYGSFRLLSMQSEKPVCSPSRL